MEQGEIEVYGVPTEHVEDLWPHLEQFVAAAILKGSAVPETTPQGVLERLKSQEAQGWVALQDQEILAFMTTYIANTETVKRVVIENIAGVQMDLWLPFYQTVEDWAVEQGADQIMVRGRPGWARKLDQFGFEPQYVALAKTL